MRQKLFLLYFRYRKPFIAFLITFTAAITATNIYQEYKSRKVYPDWKVEEVLTGDSFQVNNGDQTKTINLCGIASKSSESKAFLASLINQGSGIVELQKSGKSYEAWILTSDEQQIHLNTFMVEKGMATLINHKKCPSSENLEWAAEASL